MTKRVAFYLRVSTGDGQQTIENQRRALDEIAERAGWEVIEVYSDKISGTMGRERRPAFDRMLKAAVHRKFDMIAAWSVDRLGRSLQDLVGFLGELKAAGVDLFLHQQALDTSTPSGRALFQMLGVFAEFEAAMIRERTRAGLVRARAQGKRPRTAANHSHLIRRRVALIGRRHEHSQRSEASPCRHFDGAADQVNDVRRSRDSHPATEPGQALQQSYTRARGCPACPVSLSGVQASTSDRGNHASVSRFMARPFLLA